MCFDSNQDAELRVNKCLVDGDVFFQVQTIWHHTLKMQKRVRHPLKRVARLLSNNQHIHDKPVYLKLFQILPSYTFNKLYFIQTFSTTRYIFFFFPQVNLFFFILSNFTIPNFTISHSHDGGNDILFCLFILFDHSF